MTITTEDLVAKLQRCEELPNFFRAKMDAVAAKAMEDLTKEAGTFLFDELDDTEHTEEEIKAIIRVFPESISMEDKFSRLPVQNAAIDDYKVSFVPLLAKEGKRLNIGGDEPRGGFFHIANTLIDLANGEFDDGAELYVKKKEVLEKLRKMDLFKKEDIRNFNLLYYSSSP